MMWGMGLWHLLVGVVLLLAIAALIKYLFFKWPSWRNRIETSLQDRHFSSRNWSCGCHETP